ncbi:hypothetical protein TTHERM_000426076 (macronuclear) [Tetrahymena thermophila SB210]|uniref:Uncharacterized protein n=1 Tax=Tetrahymena thermophila (strain SB210) TaxID=312017 RepID=W7XC51_TETTS|nr:hypothetical protein TTHERM_000426076 [Tetrahymena thermophila SB210]EWS74962.1 hypothetical protein TTHERM_000426076 [Tetrahymena thermophila SB210]|eukprot:XP_012652503.1 hypothetical protein TTHERM_000426076 [Tetrahymena thermophila SB210]
MEQEMTLKIASIDKKKPKKVRLLSYVAPTLKKNSEENISNLRMLITYLV